MPLYEYECDACGHHVEKIQKFSDALLAVCPVCGGPVHKLMSSPAIQFKGTGWYITDYAKKSSGGESSKSDGSKDSAEKSEEKSAKSSESKSDTPADKSSSDKATTDTKTAKTSASSSKD